MQVVSKLYAENVEADRKDLKKQISFRNVDQCNTNQCVGKCNDKEIKGAVEYCG